MEPTEKLKEYIVWSSETVYYKTIVLARDEDHAVEVFFETGEEPDVPPYRSDFWQVDDVTEVVEEQT